MDLPDPETRLLAVNDDGERLIIGAENEFREELDLLSIFSLCFHLVAQCRAKVLQAFGVLPAIQQDLVYHNEKFAGPIRVELAVEILVGVESDVMLEHCLQEIQEGRLPGIAFLGYQKKDRQFLDWLQVKQLQIIKPQLVLLLEYVMNQVLDMRERPWSGIVIHRLIAIVKIVDLPLVMSMAGDCAETIVFGYRSRIVLSFVLTKGTVAPWKQRFLALPVDAGAGNNFVNGRADAKIFDVIFHDSIFRLGTWAYDERRFGFP